MDDDYCEACNVKEVLRKMTTRTCSTMGLTRKDVWSRKKGGRLPLARQVIWYLVRKHTKASYPELGKLTGHDHSTVHYGVRRIVRLLDSKDWLVTSLIERIDITK